MFIHRHFSHKRKNPTAYHIFCNEQRGTLKAANKDKTAAELSTMLQERWEAMDAKDKIPYEKVHFYYMIYYFDG